MASVQPRKGGRFIKKTELERREKAKESVVEINARRKVRPEPETCSNVVGRRIVDLSMLAELLWCFDCDKPLSLRDIQEEKRFGMASVLVVKCRECLDFVKVPTSSHVVDSTGRYPLYAVNCKAALGCLNSGVGPDNLNTLLTTMNIPPLSLPTFKRAQDRVGEALKLSAQESCERALIEEKALTTAAKRKERDEPEDSVEQPDEPDPLQRQSKRRKINQTSSRTTSSGL